MFGDVSNSGKVDVVGDGDGAPDTMPLACEGVIVCGEAAGEAAVVFGGRGRDGTRGQAVG